MSDFFIRRDRRADTLFAGCFQLCAGITCPMRANDLPPPPPSPAKFDSHYSLSQLLDLLLQSAEKAGKIAMKVRARARNLTTRPTRLPTALLLGKLDASTRETRSVIIIIVGVLLTQAAFGSSPTQRSRKALSLVWRDFASSVSQR